jgi:hypothetical protein
MNDLRFMAGATIADVIPNSSAILTLDTSRDLQQELHRQENGFRLGGIERSEAAEEH